MGRSGEVYILHNCGLREGLLKIGMTTRTAEIRATELATTGVPQKFLILFSQHVDDVDDAENRLHERFTEYRYSNSREFFFISPIRAISALLEEAGVIGKELPKDRDCEEVLPSLMKIYGPLLDPDLISVVIETGDEVPTSLVCTMSRQGDKVVLRRDMDFVADQNDLDFITADKGAVAAHLLGSLAPHTLAGTIPLFSRRGAQLITDMHERAELDGQSIGMTVAGLMTEAQTPTLDTVEALIRGRLKLSAQNMQVVSINEYDGHFLLSLNDKSEFPRNLHISADDDPDYQDPKSYAVVTCHFIDEMDPFDAIDVGYRCSPATWTSDGPRIRIEGMTSAGIPFEQFFSFLP